MNTKQDELHKNLHYLGVESGKLHNSPYNKGGRGAETTAIWLRNVKDIILPLKKVK